MELLYTIFAMLVAAVAGFSLLALVVAAVYYLDKGVTAVVKAVRARRENRQTS